jgi:predicted HAD superfamily phosphohydrolase YqeG
MLNKDEVKTIYKIRHELNGLRVDIDNSLLEWRSVELKAREKAEELIKIGLKMDSLGVDLLTLLGNQKKEKA